MEAENNAAFCLKENEIKLLLRAIGNTAYWIAFFMEYWNDKCTGWVKMSAFAETPGNF